MLLAVRGWVLVRCVFWFPLCPSQCLGASVAISLRSTHTTTSMDSQVPERSLNRDFLLEGLKKYIILVSNRKAKNLSGF